MPRLSITTGRRVLVVRNLQKITVEIISTWDPFLKSSKHERLSYRTTTVAEEETLCTVAKTFSVNRGKEQSGIVFPLLGDPKNETFEFIKKKRNSYQNIRALLRRNISA